ncbi:MAG: NAD-dependent epimerase/dehydratase family protein [Pirellulales bacterium]|nr:NAD-dependent epimerase/dehydratase family protein [Pirellulales bacterium]
MNALVTGGGGFLGSYVVEQLVARGDRVRAICRKDCPRLDELGVETVRADLRDRPAVVAACRGMDVVFHVGGVSGFGGSWKHFYDNNTLATCHVVEGCLVHGVGRLVYTSSPSVTFDGRSQEGIDESAPYPRRWLCHYPHSKALAERHVLDGNGRNGMLTCALRPHLIWGPRDRNLVPRLLADARRGRLCRVGDGANLIDTVYVENAAAAHLLAADALRPGSPAAGRAYFISQGEPVNCWRWIDDVLALAGLPPVRKSISARAAWLSGLFYETYYRLFRRSEEPPMNRFIAAQLSTSHYYDITRARRDLGYSPKISIAEGMRRLAAALY